MEYWSLIVEPGGKIKGRCNGCQGDRMYVLGLDWHPIDRPPASH